MSTILIHEPTTGLRYAVETKMVDGKECIATNEVAEARERARDAQWDRDGFGQLIHPRVRALKSGSGQ